MDQAIISNFAQTILIPVEAGQRTLAATRRLIQKYGNGGASTSPIKVHLLHITPRFNKRVTKNLPAGARSNFIKESAEKSVLPVTRLLDSVGMSYEIHLQASNNIPETILNTAKRLGCSQIMMGSDRSDALARFLNNSVTSKLLAKSELPVEVVLDGEASKFQRWVLPAGAGAAMIVLIAD